eukprot:351882-Chlamydomonas_euryale.AAC.10
MPFDCAAPCMDASPKPAAAPLPFATAPEVFNHKHFGVNARSRAPRRVQGPMSLMSEGYARYGDVFTVPVLHKRITFLIGPAVSPHFFKATDEEMSQKEVRTRAALPLARRTAHHTTGTRSGSRRCI